MKTYYVQTSQGHAVWTAEVPYPKVLMIHGFMRRADQLSAWRELVPGLGFLHLPGHSEVAEFAQTSVAAWVQGLGEALRRFPEPPLIVAESLGATLAMALPSRALVAAEPLLGVENLWPLRRNIIKWQARGLTVPPGVAAFFDQPFDWALASISAPTLLLAGDSPLLPERQTSFIPSLLTDADFARYAAHPLVEAHRVPGGHELLTRNTEAVLAAARRFMLRHGFLAT